MSRRLQLGRWRLSALRFLRFGLVGASGVVVNEGLLVLLHGAWRVPLLVASALAIECAIISNYLLNDRWTFLHRRPSWHRFARFNAVSVVSMVVNLTMLHLVTSFTVLPYWVANPIGIVAGFGVNYLLNVYWTYGRTLSEPDPADQTNSEASAFAADLPADPA